jgi:uncharacterized membrane protein YbhN (UPF0104 family)
MCPAPFADTIESMTTALLERPLGAATATPQTPQTVAPPSPDPLRAGEPKQAAGWMRWARLGAIALVTACLVLLGLQLRGAHLGEVLAHARPWQLAAAAGWIMLSLAAAAYNLTGFSALRVPLRQSLLAQLAISGLRLFTPSAASTPLVATRFLTRCGAPLSDAMTTVAAAQGIQLVATAGVVAGLAAVSTVSGPSLPSVTALGIGTAIAAVLVTLTWLASRRSRRVRGVVAQLGASTAGLVRHARQHPGRVLGGVLASAALTLTHVLAFAACVAAAGGHAPVLTLAAIYLGAATAGSLIPTPGGIGGVEAALIAGLTAAGVTLPVATAATLLSRLIAVWLPAIPGWWAVLRLRRAHLL